MKLQFGWLAHQPSIPASWETRETAVPLNVLDNLLHHHRPAGTTHLMAVIPLPPEPTEGPEPSPAPTEGPEPATEGPQPTPSLRPYTEGPEPATEGPEPSPAEKSEVVKTSITHWDRLLKDTEDLTPHQGCRSHPPGGWQLVRIINGRLYDEGRICDRTAAIKHVLQRDSQYVQVQGQLFGTLPDLTPEGSLKELEA